MTDPKQAKAELFVGAQNDGLFIIEGERPSPGNDSPRHDAQREVVATIHGYRPDLAELFAAAPELLALVERYAKQCDTCDGAGNAELYTNAGRSIGNCPECSDARLILSRVAGHE